MQGQTVGALSPFTSMITVIDFKDHFTFTLLVLTLGLLSWIQTKITDVKPTLDHALV